MIENASFPFYTSDDPDLSKKRVSLLLTYEQILLVASTLALFQHLHTSLNLLKRWFFRAIITDEEIESQTVVHNACINCALSMEAREKYAEN